MRIGFVAGAKYQGKIYFSALNMNALLSFDISTSELEFINIFEQENLCQWLHIEGALFQNKLWLVPMQARHIACVDLDSREIAYYDNDCHKRFAKDNLFHGCFVNGSSMYLIPSQTDTFLQVNMATDVISAIGRTDFDSRNWVKGMCLREGKLNLITGNGELQARLDPEKAHIEYLKNPPYTSSSEMYRSTLQTKDDVWMIPFGASTIKRYDLRTGKWKSIQLKDRTDTFFHGMDLGESVIFFPGGNCRNFAIVRKEDNELKMIKGAFQDIGKESLAGFYSWFEMHEIPSDEGYWATSNDGFVFEFSTRGEILHTYHIDIEKKALKDKLDKIYQTHGIVLDFDSEYSNRELEMIGLDKLIDYVVHNQYEEFDEEKKEVLQREVNRKWRDMLRIFCH